MSLGEFLQHNKQTIFILVLVIVIYYVIVSRHNSQLYDEILTGFWKCSSDFLEDAGLTSFVLYLAPPDWRGKRACYLLAEKGGDLVINEPASVCITQNWCAGNWSTGFDQKSYTAVFQDLETEDFPKKQMMVLYPKTGKLILSKGDTIYGVFFKDCFLTETIYMYKNLAPIEDEETDAEDEESD